MSQGFKLFLVALLFATVPGMFLAFSWWFGMFNRVVITKGNLKQSQMLLMRHRGDYLKVGEKISKVKKYLKIYGKPCTGVALFTRRGKTLPIKMLDSKAGCAISTLPDKIDGNFEARRVKFNQYVSFKIDAHPVIGMRKLFSAIEEYEQDKKQTLDYPYLVEFAEDGSISFFVGVSLD